MPTNKTNEEPPVEPTPTEPTPEDVEGQEEPSEPMEDEQPDEVSTEPKEKKRKGKAFFFVSRNHPGITVQVQKMVDNKATGSQEQQVAESERFTEFYDTWKGDVIRVGYLRTESEKMAERCRTLDGVEEIEEKEYTQAVEGDSKHKALRKAPTTPV